MRVPLLVVVLAAALSALAGACGGGDGGSSEGPAAIVQTVEQLDTGGPVPPGSIGALLDGKPGEDVALVFGSSDFAVGENRVTFLVLRQDGRLVDGARARVYVAPGGLDAKPTLEATAQNLPVGVQAGERGDDFDAPSVWVAHLELPAPGLYSLLVEPDNDSIQGIGQIEVRERPSAPAVGSQAIPSDTPTLEDGFPDEITTASPPDVELLRYSIAESLEARAPFVVVFATPKFCESRVCGPVVNVVDTVRKAFEHEGIRFIHVEIYEGNDPQRGFNRWVREWNLPTEPYTFVVDSEGVIRARFEGLVTVSELEAAVRKYLL